MKKVISMMMAICLLSFLVVPAIAISNGNANPSLVNSGTVLLSKHADGSYTVAQEAIEADTMATAESSDILKIADGQYLSRITPTEFVPAKKVDVDTNDIANSMTVLAEEGVSSSSLTKMEEIIDNQRAMGNTDLIVSCYIAEPYCPESGVLTASSGGVTETYTIEYRNYWTEYVKVHSGTSTKTVAKTITNLILSSVGVTNVYASIFGVGISALDAYDQL